MKSTSDSGPVARSTTRGQNQDKSRRKTPCRWKPGVLAAALFILCASRGRGTEVADTDSDGIPDWIEIHYGLDPENPDDGTADMDHDGIDNKSEYLAGGNPAHRDRVKGFANEEIWLDVGTGYVDTLAQRNVGRRKPDHKGAVSSTSVNYNERLRADHFLRRIRGYITPEKTGPHTFWATADDDCRFVLSTTDAKSDRAVLIDCTSYGSGESYDLDPSMKSVPVNLVAGASYYFELWHVEGIGGEDVHLAWLPPGGRRETIGSKYLSSYEADDPADRDDDDLPDDYERHHGLDPADPGRSEQSRDGWHGDLDGDGLCNGEERSAGSRADLPDSDGDGVNDRDEILFLGSDAMKRDAAPLTRKLLIPGAAYTANTSEWVRGEDQSAELRSRCGALTFCVREFTSGFNVVRFTIRGAEDRESEHDVEILMNQKRVLGRTIRLEKTRDTTVLALLPYMHKGVGYDIGIQVAMVEKGEAFRVISMELLEPGGPAADGGTTPEWVLSLLDRSNGFDRSQVLSRTSPATIEGRSHLGMFLNSHGTIVHDAPNGRFHTELPLQPGMPRSLHFSFANGGIDRTCEVMWAPTNLRTDRLPAVRQGDSLLLTCADDGAAPGEGPGYSLLVEGKTYSSTSDTPSVVTFMNAGDILIRCTRTRADGTTEKSDHMLKVLPRIELENELLLAGVRRDWSPAALPPGCVLEYDTSVDVRKDEGKACRSILAMKPGETTLLVRNIKEGLILGSCKLSGVTLNRISCNPVDFNDNFTCMSAEFLVRGNLADGEIRFNLIGGDVTFPDGSRVTSLYQSDMDHNGIMRIVFHAGRKSTIMGFTMSLWRRGVRIAQMN